MPTITATVESPLRRSFRIAQIEGMFGEAIRNETKLRQGSLGKEDSM